MTNSNDNTFIKVAKVILSIIKILLVIPLFIFAAILNASAQEDSRDVYHDGRWMSDEEYRKYEEEQAWSRDQEEQWAAEAAEEEIQDCCDMADGIL